MGKQSKKDKCKRISLKQKSKVLKKVKLHHKKKAKEARNVAPKNKAKVERDADIPDEPQQKKFDEAKRARAAEDMQHKKAAIIVRGQKRKLGLLEDDDMDEPNFGTGRIKDDSTGFSKIRDNSERAFYKELAKVIEASDVILEVLDARDPLGTRCADVEKMVIRAGPDKHLVLLLNKIDLVPREAAEKWLKYLREELPTVAFKCSTQEQRSHLGWKSSSKSAKSAKNAKPGSILQTSDCLGAETLIKLLKNYSRSHEIKKSITVGVVGLPNVGKSSLINSMKRSHVVNVGATPGLTRSMQEVQLDKNVKLLDCPGVVMQRSSESDASIALRNCKRIEKLEDPVGPVKEILNLCTTKMLAALYKLSDFDNVDDFLQKVAISRGRLKKGGIVDINAAAKIVLRDWNEGKIPYYTMPPNRNEGEHLEATIVSEFGKEFDVDEVYGTESSFIGSLKSVDDFQTVDPNNSLGFNQAMQEDYVKEDPSNRGDQSDTKIEDNDDDVSMDQKSDTVETRAKTATSRQNEKLYGLDGVLNTKLRRAEKKRRRKERRSTTAAMEADDDDDINEDENLDSKMDGDDQKMETATNDDALTKNKFELPVSAEELDS